MSDNTDATLGGDPTDTATVFGDPTATTPPPAVRRQMTVDEVLASARRPERTARVCLRADLEDEHAQLVAELATLVNAQGEIIAEEEAAVGEITGEARAHQINDRLKALRAEMAQSMWFVRFRGMPSEDYDVFEKKYKPKTKDADFSEFHARLVAETAIEPTISYDQAVALRKEFGKRAMLELYNTAFTVCNTGGVDVPLLPASLQALTQR